MRCATIQTVWIRDRKEPGTEGGRVVALEEGGPGVYIWERGRGLPGSDCAGFRFAGQVSQPLAAGHFSGLLVRNWPVLPTKLAAQRPGSQLSRRKQRAGRQPGGGPLER